MLRISVSSALFLLVSISAFAQGVRVGDAVHAHYTLHDNNSKCSEANCAEDKQFEFVGTVLEIKSDGTAEVHWTQLNGQAYDEVRYPKLVDLKTLVR